MYKPPVMVIDYETALLSGEASTEYYRKDFRVDSCAFTWRDAQGEMKSLFVTGEPAVREVLQKCANDEVPIVAHNLQFEMGVTICRFPEIEPKLRWLADTMRLVQVYDNGGTFKFDEDRPLTLEEELDKMMAEAEGREYQAESKGPSLGLGLDVSVRRLLPKKFHGHKAEAHDWIRANVPECGKRGRVGKYLNRLPFDIMKRYNIGDTENTLRLYEHTTEEFQRIGYDYRLDHSLFMGSVRRIVSAKIRGARVNLDAVRELIAQVEEELFQIGRDFHERFRDQIAEVERRRLDKWTSEPKTLKGQMNRQEKVKQGRKESDPRSRDPKNKYDVHVRFNVGSNAQLQLLFVEILQMRAKFFTDKGSPAFRSAVLSQWGDGGEILKKRRKRLLVLKQAQNLLALSEYDGRFHMDLKACGTATGRFAGGRH